VANYALVPGVPFPIEHLNGLQIFVVGLASDPKRLTQIRRNRLAHLSDEGNDIYADLDQVTREMQEARRLFNANGWPVLDVTRRSVEETAAAIIHHYNIWREENHAS
jgi:regulator of PEP synthase PpsR (kinase-PPPase family)